MSHVQDVVAADRLPGAGAASARLPWRGVVARVRALERVLPPRYLRYFGLVVVLYVGLYGLLLGATRGVPYVTDGNESFSMLIHASNLYHFPLSQTFGLSDEALSRDPAAHPYVYTHQGNFPRLFSFMLYLFGARTVESQIAMTTFTVGLLSVFLIYHYLSTISSTGFAVLAVIVFLTDYLLFAQWQVNTYRVWHGLFFFLSLVCVHGIEGAHRRRWLFLTVGTFACLFYFELAFATFVALMAALYAGCRYFRRPRLLAWCWAAQAAGASIALVVLVGQLVGYLGWADFLEDLRLTYTARNLVTQDPTYVDRVREFVESRHIVFWYNFASVEYRRSPAEILSSITNGYFAVYTPTLWYLVTIVTVGWFAGLGRRPTVGTPDTDTVSEASAQQGAYSGAVAGLLLVVASTRFLLAVAQDGALMGVGGPRLSGDLDEQPLVALVAAGVACGCVGAIGRLTTGCWWGVRRLPATRVILAAGTLLLAEHLVLNSGMLFDSSYLPVWLHVHETWFPGWVVQLAVVAAGGLSVMLSLNSRVASEARWPALASYLVCGLLAYVTVYALSPGYVQSGYLQRFAPFGSFVFEMAIALTIYVSWSAASALLARFGWRRRSEAGGSLAAAACVVRRTASGLAATACMALLVFPAVFWLGLQASHVRLLPATHFAFIKQLGEPPLRGASFAVNTYAAPIYAYTGQWAYFDTKLGLSDGGVISVTDEGYGVNRDASTYLWLADRSENQEYLRPEYFLCVSYQDLRTALYAPGGNSIGCSSAGIVRHATERDQPSVAGKLVARDPTGKDKWAIVKLDWRVLDRPVDRPSSGALLE